MINRALMYIDGACKGNPGPMGIGVVIKNEDGQTIKKHGEYLGHGTNNQAEYLALKIGLEKAKEEKVTHLSILSDSELLVDHVNDNKKITNSNLVEHMQDIKKLLNSFDYVSISHIRRHLNSEADRAASLAAKQELDSLD